MVDRSLPGFGIEHRDLRFKDNYDWLVRFYDFDTHWKAQPTYVISQIAFLIGGLITLLHALKRGGRWPWFWLACLFHGLVIETVSSFFPDIDNYWQSQTLVMFLGARLPLHIILLYPVFYYHAANAISRLQLPRWSEPFAVGLTVVLVDIAYDIVGIKFLHWTWHDTDPNIGDRFYWVPWNSFYFHATFSASFSILFNCGAEVDRWKYRGFFKELKSLILSSLLSMPLGIVAFIIMYHPLHDLYGVHSEVTFFVLLATFAMLAWSGDRTQRERISARLGAFDWLLILHLIAHYAVPVFTVIFGHPEREVSMGLHEKIGPCSEMITLKTFSGTTVQKRKYLCATDYDEDYSFKCLGRYPKNGASWYTVCGTPFKNRCEYIVVVAALSLLAFGVFYNCYIRTQPDDGQSKGGLKKKTKQN